MKTRLLSLLCLFALLCNFGQTLKAQEQSDDTVRVRTRVVVVDALVQDKKTGEPVRNLTRNDFQVFDEGRARTLTYFSSEGDARRRPLALLLLLDLEPFGAGKHLQRPEILQSIVTALGKLQPADEVAVVGDFSGTDYEILSGFTPDRAQTAAVLATVPNLVKRGYGSSKNADENLHAALEEVTRLATTERPGSQGVIVHLTNMFVPMFNKERSQLAAKLNREGVTYNALTCDTEKLLRVLTTIFKPAAILARASFTGTTNYLARRTGGEALRIHDPGNYGAALEDIINKLSARYSLGFTLDESERDDGRMRRLRVQVRARDQKGKERKLTVNAREGYFVPENIAVVR